MLDLSRHVVIDLARFRHDRRQTDVTDKWTLKKACVRHALDRFTCKIVKFLTYFTYLCSLFVDDVIANFVFPFWVINKIVSSQTAYCAYAAYTVCAYLYNPVI